MIKPECDKCSMELAAKAAGYEIKQEPAGSWLNRPFGDSPNWTAFDAWNPEHSSEDAFKLAIACKLSIEITAEGDGTCGVSVHRFGTALTSGYFVENESELPAAVRKAIFLAATEMGITRGK